jgi:DHA1 family bicyclomycin/chloramphenicol resistance-like MFS transporter
MTKPNTKQGASQSTHAPLGFAGFVALMGALMALNALTTDMMLPAFPQISNSFGLTNPNYVQATITAYLLGFGGGQLFVGILADRFGRKTVLFFGILIYVIGAIWATIAPTYQALLIARFLQGLGGAAPRVAVLAIVRDCYSDSKLAKVISLNMAVFMVAPLVGPLLGQLVLFVAPWRSIFALLSVYGLVTLLIVWRRLPETLAPSNRRDIRFTVLKTSLMSLLTSRQTVSYTIAAAASFGVIVAFISSAQQVFVTVYGAQHAFALLFAAAAASLSAGAYLNARLVEKFGSRRIAAVSTFAFLPISFAMYITAIVGLLSLPAFTAMLMILMFVKGVGSPNFTALAISAQGHLAGLASSMIGATTVILGTAAGSMIGQAFDGSVQPLCLGFALLGICKCLAILFAGQSGAPRL